MWGSIRADHIEACNLRLLTAVFCVPGNFEGLPVCSQRCPGPLVEPLRRNSDLPRIWSTSIFTPLKHLHAVSHLVRGYSVHRLPVQCTAEMSKPGSRDHAPSGLFRMIDWRQHLPLGFAAVHEIVFQSFGCKPLLYEITELGSTKDRRFRKFVNRSAAIKHSQMRFFYQCNPAHGAFFQLHEPSHQI